MNIIKTTLLALTLFVGFSSNAQETTIKRDRKVAHELKVIEFKTSPEQTANKRADELNAKVELTEGQLIKVKDLFLKVENRREALKNSEANESEKNNSLIELQKMEDAELQTILSPAQKKIITDSKTGKTATSM